LNRAGFPEDYFTSNTSRLPESLELGELSRSLCLQPSDVLIAIGNTTVGHNVRFARLQFVSTSENRWYYWWAAWVSIPAPED
jgi:hypothetical protein